MPAPRPTLSLAVVRCFVDEHCFPTGAGGGVGAELEWLAVESADPSRRAPLERIAGALDGLALPAGSALTTEPGGQIELSSPPAPDLGAACEGLTADLAVACSALASAGVALVGAGIDPDHRPRRLLDTPRYRAMEEYFDDGGEHAPRAGRTMMCNTASVQVNVDTARPGADRQTRWRLAHAVGPVLAAAFANSPVALRRPTGWRSSRLAAWQAIDRTRTTPAVGTRGCVDDWTTYALDARLMMIGQDGIFATVTSDVPFGRWLAEGHELGWPTVEDFAYHLTTLFPPVRAKGWLELRMIDALPDPWWRAAVAVAAALMDDAEAAAGALAACARAGTACARAGTDAARWADAARWGLADPALAAAAKRCFELALAALPGLGADRSTIDATAEYAERYVARRRCPADDAVLFGVPA